MPDDTQQQLADAMRASQQDMRYISVVIMNCFTWFGWGSFCFRKIVCNHPCFQLANTVVLWKGNLKNPQMENVYAHHT